MRRRHIALASTIIFVICLITKHFSDIPPFFSDSLIEKYFEYPLLLLQIILMRVAYISQDHKTKNNVTIANVVITSLYLTAFFYSLIITA
jgi:hypothetical protein